MLEFLYHLMVRKRGLPPQNDQSGGKPPS